MKKMEGNKYQNGKIYKIIDLGDIGYNEWLTIHLNGRDTIATHIKLTLVHPR